MLHNKNNKGKIAALFFTSSFFALVGLFGTGYLISTMPDNFLFISLFCACILILAMTVSTLVINSIYKKHKISGPHQADLLSVMYERVRNLEEPAFLCDDHGKILWYNPFMQKACGQKSSILGSYTSDFFSDDILEKNDVSNVEFAKEHYNIERTAITLDEKNFYVFVFRNITREYELEKELNDTDKLVAFIVVDNLEELLQFEQAAYRKASSLIASLINLWAESIKGICKEYEKDKYIVIFDAQYLNGIMTEKLDTKPEDTDLPQTKMLKAASELFANNASNLLGLGKEVDPAVILEGEVDEDGFNILKFARKIVMGTAGIHVTLSIGIANVKGNINFKEASSHTCLEIALQRGGDQAAVKIVEPAQPKAGLQNDKDQAGTKNADSEKQQTDLQNSTNPAVTTTFKYFGARFSAAQRRSRVKARIVANELIRHIDAATNVIIMAHKFPDYDAIGASIGISKLCELRKKPFKIVTNFNDLNVKKSIKLFEDDEEMMGNFIDSAAASDLEDTNGLLILVDVNNPYMVESPDIFNSFREKKSYIVVDHHRKTTDEYDTPPLVSYIETSASSASELVTEMLEQVMPANMLKKSEANMLLAGILLDTKQLTKNTGSKTYSAAMYLRDSGACYDNVASLFKTSLQDYQQESKYGELVEIYNDHMAIVAKEQGTTKADRILAARVADNLLKIDEIEASFVLVKIDETVHVCARSCGSVNVHLILEELGGGGHFNVAGGQCKADNMESVVTKLKAAINKHTLREES